MKVKNIFKKTTKVFLILCVTLGLTIGITAITSSAATVLYISSYIELTSSNSDYETPAAYVPAGDTTFRLHVSKVSDGRVNIENSMYEFFILTYHFKKSITMRSISGPQYLDYQFGEQSAEHKYFIIEAQDFTRSDAIIGINNGYVYTE